MGLVKIISFFITIATFSANSIETLNININSIICDQDIGLAECNKGLEIVNSFLIKSSNEGLNIDIRKVRVTRNSFYVTNAATSLVVPYHLTEMELEEIYLGFDKIEKYALENLGILVTCFNKWYSRNLKMLHQCKSFIDKIINLKDKKFSFSINEINTSYWNENSSDFNSIKLAWNLSEVEILEQLIRSNLLRGRYDYLKKYERELSDQIEIPITCNLTNDFSINCDDVSAILRDMKKRNKLDSRIRSIVISNINKATVNAVIINENANEQEIHEIAEQHVQLNSILNENRNNSKMLTLKPKNTRRPGEATAKRR